MRGSLACTLAAVVAVAAAACTGDPGAPPADADFVPTLEQTKCPPQVDNVLFDGYSCSILTVRPAGNGRPAIKLLVTKVEPKDGAASPDPFIVVGEDYGTTLNYAGIAPAADRVHRTVYFLNPRGVVGSEPELACPETDELADESLLTGADSATQERWLDAVRACYERLADDGVDLASFGEDAMPGDVLKLVEALGVESWNIASYGTGGRVSLRLAAMQPAGLRAVFLDSPSVPTDDPRVTFDPDTRRGLEALLSDCARDAACARMPHTLADVDRLAAKLDADPVDIEFTSDEEPVTVRVDGSTFMRLVRSALSNGTVGAEVSDGGLPAILASADDWSPRKRAVALFAAMAAGPTYCDGYLPTCTSQHRATLGVLLTGWCRNLPAYPQLDVPDDAVGQLAAGSPYVQACNSWPVEEANERSTAFASDVPIYAVVGEYSPYTDAKRVRSYLADNPYAHVVEVPGWGHNATSATGTCLGEIRIAFLADPTGELDTSCVGGMADAPDFQPAE